LVCWESLAEMRQKLKEGPPFRYQLLCLLTGILTWQIWANCNLNIGFSCNSNPEGARQSLLSFEGNFFKEIYWIVWGATPIPRIQNFYETICVAVQL
jgi:hypothetical protein